MSDFITPISSESDQRQHRIITLPNSLSCLLIHDPETDMAAASMDVNVGHFSDPEEFPGLAHFLEHMLFLGTEKYPDENSYSVYLNSHGGRSNAWTDMENTNYSFDVAHEWLPEAVDRFAQFFIAPLFTPSATSREMTAVHNENAKNLQSDTWRLFQFQKSISNPKHPFHKFGTGNTETLGTIPNAKGLNTRDALLKFHSQYYSANIMKLAVIGRESLDDLQKMVETSFSSIVNKEISIPKFSSDAFVPECMKQMHRVIPVKDLRQVSIFWPMPTVRPVYRTKPTRVLSHLFGHEGKGSILAYLKQKQWVNELSAGASQSTSCFSSFGITMELTIAGLEHIDEIIAICFRYVDVLNNMSDQEWERVFSEVRDVSAMNFRFKGKEDPFSYTSSMAGNMQIYPAAEALSGGWLFHDFQLDEIKRYLSHCTVDNSQIVIVSNTYADVCQETEQWYGTKFASQNYTQAMIEKYGASGEKVDALHVPGVNEFIATDFTLHSLEDRDADGGDSAAATAATTTNGKASSTTTGVRGPKFPQLLNISSSTTGTIEDGDGDSTTSSTAGRKRKVRDDDDGSDGVLRDHDTIIPFKVWHKHDQTFLKPKLNVFIQFISDLAYSSPRASVLTNLFTSLLEDSLVEFAYDADCAGLYYDFYGTVQGLALKTRGYSHKLPILLLKICERVVQLEIKEDRFTVLREQQMRSMKNFQFQQPYQHAMYERSLVMDQTKWHWQDKIAEIEQITVDDLRLHTTALIRSMNVEMLIHGNIARSGAVQLVHDIKRTLATVRPLYPSQIPHHRIVDFSRGHDYIVQKMEINPADKNSALVNIYPLGPDSLDNQARLYVLAHIMSEPCFNQLRTHEQLGYLVWSGMMTTSGHLSLRVILQSSERTADYLDARAESFLYDFVRILEEMSDETFATQIEACLSKKREKDKRLAHESNRHWNEICRQRYQYDRVDRECDVIAALKKSDLIAMYREVFLVNAPRRAKLSCQIFGNQHKLPAERTEEETKACYERKPPTKEEGGEAAKKDDDPAAAAAEEKKKDEEEIPWVEMAPESKSQRVDIGDDWMRFKNSMPMLPYFRGRD